MRWLLCCLQTKGIKMNKILILLISSVVLFASENLTQEESKLVNCYEIFNQRKMELEEQASEVEAQRQALQALKDATMHIFKKKEQMIDKKQKELNATLQKIENTKTARADRPVVEQKIIKAYIK